MALEYLLLETTGKVLLETGTDGLLLESSFVEPRPIRINTSQGWADIGDATSFVSGSGAPTVAVGATGAIYLNTATGLLYGPKAGGVWPGSPITVPSGGTTYRVGSGAPASGLGAVGDLYEDLLTADLYQKQNYTGAPLLRASATNLTEASNSTSHTCPVPAGVVVGDLLILLVAQYVYDGATVTPPSGWTSRGNHADGSATSGAGMAVFTRVADGTEGSSVSFTTSASGAATSAILAYIFASVDAVADFGSSQSTATPTVPSVTSTTANDAIVGICLSAGSLGGAPSGTPASGWTEKLDAQNAGIGSLLYVMDKAQAVAGASGTAVPTFASGRWWTWALAVKSSGSTPAWIKIEDRSVATDTIWDAKGDLAVATGADVAAKLVVGSNNQVLTADSTQTTGVKWAAPAAPTGGAVKLFDSLLAVDTVTIDTGASGIAGGYAALEVFLYGRTDEGAQGTECYFQLNNDTGANYDWQRVSGSAATVTGSNTNADSGWDAFVAGASSGANSFGMVHLLIPNYDGTVGFKAGRWTDGFADPAGSGRIAVKSGIWRNTAAITRLSVHAAFSGTVKFKAGSRLTIFGLG
jgi:hypothetical protein